MTIELEPELEKAIDELIAGGGYHSHQEVIREAVELLKSREATREEQLARLRREIQLGLDQLERGEGLDAEEVFEELLRGLPDSDDSEP